MKSKCKQSLYFPQGVIDEMHAEAKRQDRSMSWLVQMAWKIARHELMAMPSHDSFITSTRGGT
jgi:uncharacterized small protein (TIGR04563 family)